MGDSCANLNWWTTERGLLPNFIRNEKVHASAPCLVVASPEGIVDEFTFADIENASNRAAWFLAKTLAADEDKVFYMGRMDLRYFLWMIGAMKAGKCVVFASPSNTVAANKLLFGDVGAKTLLFSPENSDVLEALHADTKDSIRWVETPSYDEMNNREPVDVFPFTPTFEQVWDKPCVGLHTSGTTGHPKPIYWNHSALPIFASQTDRRLRAKDSPAETFYQQLFEGKRCILPFPFYHAGGLIAFFASIICRGKGLAVAVPGMQLSAENLTGFIQASRADSAMVAPSLLADMLKYPPGLAALARLQSVCYGGGPMNPAAGEKLSKVLPHLFSAIGSTEAGFLHTESTTDSAHWNSFKFAELGHRMDEVDPGLFELVYPKTDLIHRTHLLFHSFPTLTEYRTKDLFAPVEGEPGWWVYAGRKDNWVAMSNGLKFDPKTTEDTIAYHPDVRAVIVAGGGRYRLCLLVELEDHCYRAAAAQSAQEEEERAWRQQMLETVWPVIEEANHKAPRFGRIPKELVLFTARDKPFSRLPKGTVQRHLTLAAYEREIDRLYEQSEQGLLTQGLPPLKSTAAEELVPFLTSLCAQTLERAHVGPDDDVFALGMDSFAVASLSSRLKAALRAQGAPPQRLDEIGIRLIYERPTAELMAARLSAMLSPDGGGDAREAEDAARAAMALLDKYENKVRMLFDAPAPDGANGHAANGHAPGLVVAVTGTTGSMGTYLLATLLARPDVDKVICLNRAAGAEEKQATALRQRGLPPLQPAMEQGRVVFMQIDVAAPRLGLTDADYAVLVAETTAVVHNAFPVNFLMTTQQFEPQFVGMLSLLEAVRAGRRHPSFLVVSSVSVAATSGAPGEVVPEAVLARGALRRLPMQGYGSAKFICERMTHVFAAEAARRGAPVATGVLRVGQVAGPRAGAGAWNVWEWLPSIVVSSKYLGAAPDSLGFWTDRIDFVPVDALASIMSELIGATELRLAKSGRSNTVVYNVVNPRITTWAELLPAVQRVAPKLVPLKEWVELLEKTRDASAHNLDRNPGVKLIDFYKALLGGEGGSLPMSTTNLVRESATAADLGPITQDQMGRWIEGWSL